MSTPELETFLKTELARRPSTPALYGPFEKTVYTLLTEHVSANDSALRALIGRYFAGATLTYVGLDSRTQASDEQAVTIMIVTSAPDALQRIVNLAGDIRILNNQISVLITRQPVTTFEVVE